jgi:hypothetical protein
MTNSNGKKILEQIVFLGLKMFINPYPDIVTLNS